MLKKLNLDRISKNKNEILESLSQTKDFLSDCSLKEFEKDSKTKMATERAVMIIVEAMGNIAYHIIARHFNYTPNGIPDSFLYLSKKKVIDNKLGEQLKNMAKFRNKLTHHYWNTDYDKLFKYVNEELEKNVKKFIKMIEEYVKRTKNRKDN